jgi:hypothetical protein
MHMTQINNFMLILSLGSVIPFFNSLYTVVRMIPCPRIAAFVSDSALVGTFVGLILVGVVLYKDPWLTYVYLMAIWPWIAIATVLARLHIGQDRDVTNFSPFLHLPLLALLGAGSWIAMVYAIHEMYVTDAIVLACVDPFFAAIFHVLLIRRIKYIEEHGRMLIVSVVVVMLYIYGTSYTGGVVKSYYDSVKFITLTTSLPLRTYLVYFAGRAAHILRCSYIKKSFVPAQKGAKSDLHSLFPNFPFPIRFRLDVLFDSGLVEEFPHGIGPTGTRDLYSLTDDLYLLPLASIASWVMDNIVNGTLSKGLSPTNTTASAPSGAVVYVIVVLFIIAFGLIPYANSRILFDRGSSPHTWVAIPLIVQLPYVCIDLLYVNTIISRFQIVCLLLLLGLITNLRNQMWQLFKKRFFTYCMEELKFLQPSCLRPTQRQVLSEAREMSGVDDFGCLLLETAIHHGNNIKGYLRDDDGKVWDPKPSATAAWKLAGSLVIRSIRNRKQKMQTEQAVENEHKVFVESIVNTMVDSLGQYGRRSR